MPTRVLRHAGIHEMPPRIHLHARTCGVVRSMVLLNAKQCGEALSRVLLQYIQDNMVKFPPECFLCAIKHDDMPRTLALYK